MVNTLLRPLNARLESRTAELSEANRLRELESRGYFNRAVFPVLPQFSACDPLPIFEQIERDKPAFSQVVNAREPSNFPLRNDYCTTPDAEVLYAVVQLYRPARIVEVGSGYSTQLFRLAIQATGLDIRLTSVDPSPRQEVSRYCDLLIRERVEQLENPKVFHDLRANDILFIDSSHEIKTGNDLLHIMFTILPGLASGALIHFHDIFLPYEYPREWIVENRWNWTEQYLVQAFLTGNSGLEVLWPGYYLQRTRPNFEVSFEHWHNSTARSLWLRKR